MKQIIKSIQESAEGWRLGFASILGGGQIKPGEVRTQLGLIGPGYTAAARRFEAVKAGKVVQSAVPVVGVRYIPGPTEIVTDLPGGIKYTPSIIATQDPGTPASVVESIQKSIGESAEGWRMGFAHLTGKLGGVSAQVKAGIEKSLAGWGMGISHVGGEIKKGVGSVGESFGNIGSGIGSFKWLIYILIFIFAFVAVMVSIGYSGVGGPAARVAEQEYGRRR